MHARFSGYNVSIDIETVLSRSMCPCSLVGTAVLEQSSQSIHSTWLHIATLHRHARVPQMPLFRLRADMSCSVVL